MSRQRLGNDLYAFSLRETRLTTPRSMYACARKPSHFNSKTQSGWSNGWLKTANGMCSKRARGTATVFWQILVVVHSCSPGSKLFGHQLDVEPAALCARLQRFDELLHFLHIIKAVLAPKQVLLANVLSACLVGRFSGDRQWPNLGDRRGACAGSVRMARDPRAIRKLMNTATKQKESVELSPQVPATTFS